MSSPESSPNLATPEQAEAVDRKVEAMISLGSTQRAESSSLPLDVTDFSSFVQDRFVSLELDSGLGQAPVRRLTVKHNDATSTRDTPVGRHVDRVTFSETFPGSTEDAGEKRPSRDDLMEPRTMLHYDVYQGAEGLSIERVFELRTVEDLKDAMGEAATLGWLTKRANLRRRPRKISISAEGKSARNVSRLRLQSEQLACER